MKRTRKKNRFLHQTPNAMGVLAVGMADDFNNILTTVMGACSLIDKDKTANNELLQYVDVIRTSAERAAVLSDKLIEASSQNKNTLPSDCNRVDLKLKNSSKE